MHWRLVQSASLDMLSPSNDLQYRLRTTVADILWIWWFIVLVPEFQGVPAHGLTPLLNVRDTLAIVTLIL